MERRAAVQCSSAVQRSAAAVPGDRMRLCHPAAAAADAQATCRTMCPLTHPRADPLHDTTLDRCCRVHSGTKIEKKQTKKKEKKRTLTCTKQLDRITMKPLQSVQYAKKNSFVDESPALPFSLFLAAWLFFVCLFSLRPQSPNRQPSQPVSAHTHAHCTTIRVGNAPRPIAGAAHAQGDSASGRHSGSGRHVAVRGQRRGGEAASHCRGVRSMIFSCVSPAEWLPPLRLPPS